MIFRQTAHLHFLSYRHFWHRELVLLLLIAFSLGSGWLENTYSFFVKSQSHNVWNIQGAQAVKGDSDVAYEVAEQIREIEILPAKVERVVVKPTDTEPKEWGVAKQIGEHTWTMNVNQDETMASPSEIISALNSYRSTKGRGTLSFDSKLSEYAQSRANFFTSQNGMDSHAGFQDLISNQDGFTKLGFFALGENSSFGYQLSGTHLIEWVFAGDAPHDNNQLNPEWSHVGVGVNGVAVDIIFGGRKQ